MRSSTRTLRELGVVGIVLALVIGIVVAAVQAEGERTIRPDTNDGGAWLINADAGVVGHINRTAGEVTGVARIATPGDDIDTEQSGDAVLVINHSAGELKLVDARTFQEVNSISVPNDTEVRMTGDTAVAWTVSPLRVWRLDVEAVRQLQVLDSAEPVISDDGDGIVEVTSFGTVLAVATARSELSRLAPDMQIPEVVDLGVAGADVVAVTATGDTAALLTKAGALYRIEPDSTEMSSPLAFGAVVALGQPTLPGEAIVAVTDDGTVLATPDSADATADAVVTVSTVPGSTPLRPLAFRNCVFVVTVQPAELTRACNGNTEEPVPLQGATGASLRLRLVNGWVWVNDLRNGNSWVINETAPLDRIDDWGAALANTEGEGDESEELESGEVEQRENPDADDAELIRADEIDEDGVNEPPVASPDFATTRVDLPVVVDVLRNDIDADGDVILVTELSGAPADALVNVTGDRREVQVIPNAGFIGDIQLSYTISDGRGGTDTDTITVTVIPAENADNRPPVAVTDVAEVRAGSAAALNVLDNDSDPDGDSIVLTNVEAPSGSATFDGSGQVTFVPDPATTERSIEIDYTIRDSFGATASGTIRVAIRLRDSNNEPDARNDSAVTTVGRPVTLNVLINDTDPDGDAISVAAPPVLLVPASATGLDVSLTADGQFFFVSETPGEFVYSYSIIDGSERDIALIRVDVSAVEANRPPVAVRDDATIARGASSTIFVLANDTDPDGDVVAIENVGTSEFLQIESFRGIGFIVTVLPEAPAQVTFPYTITDGVADPVPGTVVVAITDTNGVDQPPVVTPDVMEARPGATSAARVLLNDFDPEGGVLRIDRVSEVDGVEIRIGQNDQEVLVTLAEDAVNGFSFSYDVVDEAGNRNAAVVDVRIVPDDGSNRPPIARADTARTRTSTGIVIPVLDNDTDPDGDPIRIESIVAQPAAGTAVVNLDNTVTYTPDANFAGTDRFAYVIADRFGDRAIGQVLVGVIPQTDENRPPTAIDDTFTIVAGTDVIALPVTANDFDPDGDLLRITRFTQADSVRLSESARDLIFTPPVAIERDSVVVTMTYRIDDGRGGSADATVTVTVVKAADAEAPIPADDVVGPIRPGESIAVRVLDNDLDPDGRREALIVNSVDGAGAPGDEPGLLVFTAGPVTSTHPYTVTDADGLSARAFVTILVTENVAPVVAPVVERTPYETALSLDLGAQATDRDGDPLFFVCCDAARNGTVAITESGQDTLTVVFTPDPAFSGPAGFSYSVDDQQGHQVSASVTIIVDAKINSAPTATDITGTVEAGTTGSIALSANTADVDLPTGDVLSYQISDEPAGVSRAGDTVAIVAPLDAAGQTITFGFTVTDSSGESAAASAAVTVTESRISPPTAAPDRDSTTQGVSVTVDVVSNDLDEIGDGLRLIAAGSTGSNGQIDFSGAAGTVTFVPAPEFFGTTTVSYTIEDARRTAAGQAVGQLTVDVIGFPGVPPTPQATADNATATVTWGQPQANGAPIEEFELRSDQGQTVLLSPSSSHTFNGLANGVPHSFEVRARNVAGWSPWSSPSAPVTPDTEPQRPAAPTITFGDSELKVDWVQPGNDGSAITDYILEIGGASAAPITLGAVTTYTWKNLTNGTNYQFRVTAVNGSGNSDTSTWSASEHPLREPDASGSIAATRGNRYLDIDWAAPVDNGDPIIQYQVQMQSAPGLLRTTTDRNYRWSDLTNGIEQQYRVRSRNRDVDWSTWSTWSVPVKACGPPLAPTTVSAVRGDTLATVSWAAPDDQGCAIQSYRIEAVGTGLSQSAGAGATSHSFTGLTNGQSYTFQVIAINEVNPGPPSGASNAVTPAGPPLQPNAPNVTPQSTSGEVRYSVPGPNDNGAAITSWRLSVSNGAAENASLTSGAAAATVTGLRSGLAPNTTYGFRVQACNAVGCSSWSATTSQRTFGPPPQASNFRGSAGDQRITASWNAISNPSQYGPGFYYFIVLIEPYGTFPQRRTQNTSETWTCSSCVHNYQEHDLSLEVCNDLGCSPRQTIGPFTPRPPLSIQIAKSGIPHNDPQCNTPSCEWVTLDGRGLNPNTTYTTHCQDASGDFTTRPRTTDSNGRMYVAQQCFYGYPGSGMSVRIVGAGTSNTIVW